MSVPPMVTRDALVRAYGVDCLMEDGKILFIGSSIEDWPAAKSPLSSSTDSDIGHSTTDDNTGGEPAVSRSSIKSSVDLAKQPWKKPSSWFHDRMVVKDFKRSVE